MATFACLAWELNSTNWRSPELGRDKVCCFLVLFCLFFRSSISEPRGVGSSNSAKVECPYYERCRNWFSNNINSGSVFQLKEIMIANCSSMKTLLPPWLLPNLQNLEEIFVGACSQLVEILGAATSEVEEKGSDALIKFHLPKLRKLVLWRLPNLKSICSKCGVMVCDSLELISVDKCDKLKRIPPFVPFVGNGQPFAYAPPSLTIKSRKEWWESLEWDDHPNFKNVLRFNPRGG
ncbi:hypothetical protein GOBAR_DD28351 [Gossypium barbadense]|nr:hypothetical protein GOBAR_DD28351 [Gossypium barbadense]